ncbi:hypothetical protein ACQJBY_015347 [Aegilops geniculata]
MMMQEQDGGAAAAAAEAMAPVQIDVRMDVALLHCQACLLPLKPPVFKCEAAGHVVCCFCRAGHAALCSRASATAASWTSWSVPSRCPCPTRCSAASATWCTMTPRTTSARAGARPAPARSPAVPSWAPARRSSATSPPANSAPP